MKKEKLDLYEFMGKKVLFTPCRTHQLDEKVPEELYKYEIRHSDEGFEPCELAKYIMVNHYGTIFSKESIDLGKEGFLNFTEDIDFIDLNETMTFDEYINTLDELYNEQEDLEDIEVYHRKVSGIENIDSVKVSSLLISDPWYDENVSCRYEKDNLDMNLFSIGLLERDCVDLRDNFQFHDSLLIIMLENKNSLMKEISKKEYQIGVDTAEYSFQCNEKSIDIKTMSDGFFGAVTEHYYGDLAVLGSIEIELSVPDEMAMSQKEFIDSILSAIGISNYDMKVIEEVDNTLGLKEDNFQMNMK